MQIDKWVYLTDHNLSSWQKQSTWPINKSFEIQFCTKVWKTAVLFHTENHNQTTFQQEDQPFVTRKRLGSVGDYINAKKFDINTAL